jgi:hypothetical protein
MRVARFWLNDFCRWIICMRRVMQRETERHGTATRTARTAYLSSVMISRHYRYVGRQMADNVACALHAYNNAARPRLRYSSCG